MAIASVALPAALAQSSVRLTAKQAAVLGLPATAPTVSEEMVGALIVKMRATGAQAQGGAYVRSLANMAGVSAKVVRAVGDSSVHVALDAPMTLADARTAAARLAADPTVEYAEPDVTMKPFAVPNEADFALKQWNLFPPASIYPGNVDVAMGQPPKTTSAPAAGAANLISAWDRTTGSDTVVVAIIDTGIVNHPDLNNAGLNTPLTYAPAGRFLPGYDFVSTNALGLPNGTVEGAEGAGQVGRDNNPADPGDAVSVADRANALCNDNTPNQGTAAAPSTWHGTHTAGVVAATSNNSTGIAGIGWNVKILPVRALGRCGGAMSDIADAILWSAGLAVTTAPAPPANANAAKVILIGAGGKAGVACSQTLQSAIDAAVGAGSVVVAAAGNEGSVTGISAPANCNNVIAVTAHAINGENATYSNIDAEGGSQVSISAAGGGSPGGQGGLGAIDDPLWDGYYIWSTSSSGTAGPVANTPTAAYARRIGTSAAAAQVAGVAALIKSAVPAATPAQIKGAITTSARPFPDLSLCAPGRQFAGRCGIGMLDATRALQAAGPPFVVTPPANVTVAVGATASFAIEAIGVVTYQWIRNGVPIAGANGPTYTTPPLAATDTNVAFQVNMSNSFGGTTSPAGVVTVTSTAANSPSGGGAIPAWQVLLLSALLLAARLRVAYRKQ
ncbi:MAG TPA: S8 family serine peptidase [Burkholderiaceae bacterium]|nr:S8 family serine peptidase [Burkholderiaceae bacterium]